MRNPNEYSIELNLYNKNNPVEITRFFSIVFDKRKVDLSAQNKKKLVDKLYKETKIKRKDDSFNEIFLSFIYKNIPPIFPHNANMQIARESTICAQYRKSRFRLNIKL